MNKQINKTEKEIIYKCKLCNNEFNDKNKMKTKFRCNECQLEYKRRKDREYYNMKTPEERRKSQHISFKIMKKNNLIRKIKKTLDELEDGDEKENLKNMIRNII
jgi:DNA-directed RNA polymerase subunit RPC12/RpoP